MPLFPVHRRTQVRVQYPNEGGKGGECPPEWDVNLFILRVGGRGVCGDVAVQGLILGSASVCLFVCLFVCLLVRTGFGGWSGSEFRGKDRTKRFRRARSTKSEREVGSDSLILGLLLGQSARGARGAGNLLPGKIRPLASSRIRLGASAAMSSHRGGERFNLDRRH